MACDICSKTGIHLEQLNTQYQTDKIKSICSECSTLVDKQLWAIRKLNQTFLERAVTSFMVNKRKNLATDKNTS